MFALAAGCGGGGAAGADGASGGGGGDAAGGSGPVDAKGNGGGAGGMGDGGAKPDGGIACVVTLMGAVTGTSACTVTLEYVPAQDDTSFTLSGGPIPGTSAQFTSFHALLSGMAATGTFDKAPAILAAAEVSGPAATNQPRWDATLQQGGKIGAMSLTLTSLGDPTTEGDRTAYAPAHGSGTATLVDQNPMTAMPDVQLLMTF
jgi:hypothetical protein